MSWKKWVTLVAIVAVAGGIAGAMRVQSAQAAGATRRLTIPAAAFTPSSDNWDYVNNGDELDTLSGGAAYFTAPVVFPVDLKHVRITRLIMRVYDNGAGPVCVDLWRVQPRSGGQTQMAHKCSTSASTQNPRSFVDKTISPDTAAGGQALQLWLQLLSPGSTYKFYGVTIEWQKI